MRGRFWSWRPPAASVNWLRAGNKSPVQEKDAVTITPYRDGPLLIRGAATLLAPGGEEISCNRDPVALCRCGRSKIKPFCDGTHKLVGFSAPAGRLKDAK